jgi:phosphate transport system substrate-binding protein
MKTRIFLLTLAAFNCMAVRAQMIKIGGSTTLQDVFNSAAKDFNKTHSNNQFIIDEKGSKIGIDSLYESRVDIALTSRPLEPGEREKLNSKDSLIEKIVAYDGLMIVVNPQTGIKQLTKDQVG